MNLYNWGVFETMRAYQGKIVYLAEHLERIRESCALLKITCPYSKEKLKGIIQKEIEKSNLKDAYVRLTLWPKPSDTGINLIVKGYQPYPAAKYRKGFSASISTYRVNENNFLNNLKTTNRLLYQLSLQEAKDKGFDEAILLNNRGYISEGSRSNIFLVEEKEIFTPALECGCLRGITRQVIFDLTKKYRLKIYEGSFTAGDLFKADEAFFTNSLIGVMPLEAKCGRLTKFFIQAYNLLLGK